MNIRSPLYIVLSLLWPVGPLNAALPDLIYTFEQTGEGGCLEDLGQGKFQIQSGKNASLNNEEAKFGTSSLRISESTNTSEGWNVLLNDATLHAFRQETSRLSIAAWVKLHRLETSVIFWRIPGGTREAGFFQFSFLGNGLNRLYFAVSEGGGENESGYRVMSPRPLPIEAECWHHLAMTFDEGTVQFYFDGQSAGKETRLSLTQIPAAMRPLASIKGGGMNGGGRMDDFLLMGDRVLSAEEIAQIYENGIGVLTLE